MTPQEKEQQKRFCQLVDAAFLEVFGCVMPYVVIAQDQQNYLRISSNVDTDAGAQQMIHGASQVLQEIPSTKVKKTKPS